MYLVRVLVCVLGVLDGALKLVNFANSNSEITLKKQSTFAICMLRSTPAVMSYVTFINLKECDLDCV